MRTAKQYSIIDHQILHRGYFHSLSHEALVLYFFLITVGDKSGRSYYSESKIIQILRLGNFKAALTELCRVNLIAHRPPNYWVNNLDQTTHTHLSKHKKKNEYFEPPLERSQSLESARSILRNILIGPSI